MGHSHPTQTNPMQPIMFPENPDPI